MRDVDDLIAKLQAKADRTTFPAEREALLAKIGELRAKTPAAPPPADPMAALRIDEALRYIHDTWTTANANANVGVHFEGTWHTPTWSFGADGWDPPSGVREPRRPPPGSPPDAAYLRG